MEQRHTTTPFGRRPMTLAFVAAQAEAKARPADKAAHKWQVLRDLSMAKKRLGVSERALAVLDALLSFHPETVLTGDGLIVFPSNVQLGLRAHGMAQATLRRHLGVLVDAGIIIRRDSPNGKRYARKGRDGEIEKAFGFDLSPLVTRAEEFADIAEAIRAEDRAFRLARERISLCRRDIVKMIATGMEEGVPLPSRVGPADWAAMHAIFRGIIGRIPRAPRLIDLDPLADELAMLADEITKLLEDHAISQNKSGNESQTERHKQNSNPNPLIEFEPRFSESGAASPKPMPVKELGQGGFPLGMVLDACPDLTDYARNGIDNWRDFVATVAVIRPMLGISPSAWEEALEAMGELPAAMVVAAILQRSSQISSAGGYLRDLTRRAREGEFSFGPMLMALFSTKRRRERLRA